MTVIALASCSSPVKRTTLRDIDISGIRQSKPGVSRTPENPENIRRAYLEYLKHASKNDKSRVDALHRLAQLEFQLNEAQSRDAHNRGPDDGRDDNYLASIDRNINLLQTLLRDHPDVANADKTLYQLARAYDQRGLNDKSIEALEQLVKRFPKSPHYVESQFRLAERAFIRGHYSNAEDLYTDVLVSRNNSLFREKARYKRGWARFKQNYFREAIDDFVVAIGMNDFEDLTRATEVEKNNFEEYFRALGLTFVYMGGPDSLHAYFKENPGFKYIHETYFRVSDHYRSEQRYSDASAVLDQFSRNYPQSGHLPEAALKKIDVWVASGFYGNLVRSLEEFYAVYHPQSSYWSKPDIRKEVRTSVIAALRSHILLVSSLAHKEYQSNKSEATYSVAKMWYERYLKDYQAYSRKDNVHFLYAELLALHKNHAEALAHYEQAAFDGDIIVNQDAAYAAVSTTAKLHQMSGEPQLRKEYLNKLVHHSLLFVRLYPGSKQSLAIMTRAAEEAYRDGMYQQAIELAELIAGIPYTGDTYNIHSLKAHSYFKLERYQDAEAAYQTLLRNYKLDPKTQSQINDNLAISIYNQATVAKARNSTAEALRHYARMSELVPASGISATGLYEAIALAFDNKLWPETVGYIERFQKLYPSHKFNHDVSKKLSVAYLNTNQEGAAASELIKASRADEDIAYKTAALWKAAELYAARKDYPSAIKAFEEYAATYQRPYPQYLESMHKLVELYVQTRNDRRANQWRNSILDADKRVSGDLKTDRTNYISSLAALHLARQEHVNFSSIRLTLPLERSLGHKKNALQKVLNLYGRAASYGIAETASEATYGIADVYHSFSKALLESERPRNLGKAELDQYKILLEDQAFPFEDNAIKFYEKNLSYIRQGVSNEWVNKSHAQLRLLFPARYSRSAMLESSINVLH